ncbi:integrase [Thalassotalea nanhaiensis]|uniref:Integrase n=1 Tax=Thalassotalea nanhaiensis TaxID=3065648 RepID=A0ABY9TMH7_9GAMM|nr:integrase [Colwelliaceae bacterium SQ345]
MAPRKRKFENRDLPVGLCCKMVRGQQRFRYRYPSGKDIFFPLKTQKYEAIEAATIFNAKHRNPALKMILDHDEFNKPMSHWIKVVIERVRNEELNTRLLSKGRYRAFVNDTMRLDELLGDILSKSISLQHVNEFLDKYASGKSNEVYNRKITFLKKIFSYICDMSGMVLNPADRKKRKPKQAKQRKRLNIEYFNLILNASNSWLNIAMRLSLQTTHAVNEISLAKYKDCEWFNAPIVENGLTVYGVLRIHRQKVQNKEASRVEIPITKQLKKIIDDSKRDNIASPYIVHALLGRKKGLANGLTHPTQLTPVYISRAMSDLRDELNLYGNFDKPQRPTFHEIRALSIFLYDKMGIDPQERAAHTDAESTKVYMKDHVKWVKIQPAELVI